MPLNISSGRLRDYVQFYNKGAGSDEYGEPNPPELVLEAFADTQVKSGGQLVDYGASLTEEVVTMLMWYDERVNNAMLVMWNGVYYEVQHVKPDEIRKGMIITVKVERDG